MIETTYKVYAKDETSLQKWLLPRKPLAPLHIAAPTATVRAAGGRLGKPVERVGYTEFASKGGVSGAMRACHMNPTKSCGLSENQESRATFMSPSLGASYNKNGEPQDVEQFFKRALEVA